MSSVNPYAPPKSDLAKSHVDSEGRRAARWSVRFAVGCLAIPALANWACVHLRMMYADETTVGGINQLRHQFWVLVAGGNFFWTCVALITAWFFFLPVVEKVGEFVWHRTNRKLPLSQWHRSTWRGLRSLRIAAPLGAATWIMWLGYFFFTNLQLGITPLFAVAGHCVAAMVYGSVAYQWYLAAYRGSAGENSRAESAS